MYTAVIYTRDGCGFCEQMKNTKASDGLTVYQFIKRTMAKHNIVSSVKLIHTNHEKECTTGSYPPSLIKAAPHHPLIALYENNIYLSSPKLTIQQLRTGMKVFPMMRPIVQCYDEIENWLDEMELLSSLSLSSSTDNIPTRTVIEPTNSACQSTRRYIYNI